MTSTSSAKDENFAGDPIPPKCAVIEVHVGELKQLLDAIDPSPFRDRDLDPKAEEFIVGWAKDLPRDASLALVVDLDREAGLPDEPAVLRDAIHEFFGHRAETYRQRLRELFGVGRSLAGFLRCDSVQPHRSKLKKNRNRVLSEHEP